MCLSVWKHCVWLHVSEIVIIFVLKEKTEIDGTNRIQMNICFGRSVRQYIERNGGVEKGLKHCLLGSVTFVICKISGYSVSGSFWDIA